MGKGISTVIGSLLILIMVVALGGLSYTFFTATVSNKNANTFDIVGVYEGTLEIKNTGDQPITEISARLNGENVQIILPEPILAGLTGTIRPNAVLTKGTHTLDLCTKSACGTAVLAITQDPASVSIQTSANVNEVGAGDTVDAQLTVTLSQTSNFDVQVDYSTADGTATAGSDYTATSGTLVIPAGQATGAITVTVQGDNFNEPDETFTVQLSNAQGSNIGDSAAVVTITNFYIQFDDCLEILNLGVSTGNGTYAINPGGTGEFQVYCDMSTGGGGWTLVATTADDNTNTWSYNNRNYLWDNTPVGSLDNRDKDFKSDAYAKVLWTDMLFMDKQGNWAAYAGINPPKDKAVSAWMPQTLACPTEPGRNFSMTAGNLITYPGQIGKMQHTKVYFTVFDGDTPSGCVSGNNAYGPTWSYKNNYPTGNSPTKTVDEPELFGWGVGVSGGNEKGNATLGNKTAYGGTDLNSGYYIQWYVR